MLEVAWGLRNISSGKMKSTLGTPSSSRMLEVASRKKRSRSKYEEQVHDAPQGKNQLFFLTSLTFPEIQADLGIFKIIICAEIKLMQST
jgi:hypothetical protein